MHSVLLPSCSSLLSETVASDLGSLGVKNPATMNKLDAITSIANAMNARMSTALEVLESMLKSLEVWSKTAHKA